MAQRRVKNTALCPDGKHREYRLRKVGTVNEYVNYFRSVDQIGANGQRKHVANSQRPTFNKRGKVFTSQADVEAELGTYALRRLRYPFDKADFPALEIVVNVIEIEGTLPDPTPPDATIKKLMSFSEAIAKGLAKIGKKGYSDYSAEFALAEKLVFQHEPFRYILVTKGVIDRSIIKATAAKARIGVVGRMTDETICCFAVNTDTDLTFARMALNENLVTIWDYEKAKVVFGQPISRY